jgi:capsular polysaccharide biosynthesis protein
LANTYKDRIKNNRIQKEEETQKIYGLENKIQKQLMAIDKLEFDIKNIENIKNIQPPSGTPYPIKPKIKLIVLLGIVAGFVLTMVLAFFLEYILKYRKMNVPFN